MNISGYSEPFFIKVCPLWTSHLGDTKASMLVARFEYWSSKYRDGFWKYLEPCKAKTYREGDSWSEELSLSRKAFNKKFDKIGIRYSSKSKFLAEKDPFKGKPYAMYFDRQLHKAFFIRNHEIANEFLKKLNSTKSNKKSKNPFIHQNSKIKSEVFNNVPLLERLKVPLPEPKEYSNIYNNKNNNINNIQITTSFNVELEKIWNEELGRQETFSKYIQKKISKAFEKHFQNSIEKWKEFCHQIAISDFLMGRIGDFKIWILWALKQDTIERIKLGEFNRMSKKYISQNTESDEQQELNSILECEMQRIERNIEDMTARDIEIDASGNTKQEYIKKLKSLIEKKYIGIDKHLNPLEALEEFLHEPELVSEFAVPDDSLKPIECFVTSNFAKEHLKNQKSLIRYCWNLVYPEVTDVVFEYSDIMQLRGKNV